MVLKLAKRVVEELTRPHFMRLVADAYGHPDEAGHRRLQAAARSWYGIGRTGSLDRAWSQFFIELVYQAQLRLFRGGSDLDLGASPLGCEDLVLECHSSDANSSAVYLYGFSDNLTYFTLYREHVRPGSAAMDVGANLGIHSLVLSRCAGDRGQILTYEPSGPIHGRLLGNIARNRAANIVPKKLGLWEKSGSAGFEPRAGDFNIGKGQVRQDSARQGRIGNSSCLLGSGKVYSVNLSSKDWGLAVLMRGLTGWWTGWAGRRGGHPWPAYCGPWWCAGCGILSGGAEGVLACSRPCLRKMCNISHLRRSFHKLRATMDLHPARLAQAPGGADIGSP